MKVSFCRDFRADLVPKEKEKFHHSVKKYYKKQHKASRTTALLPGLLPGIALGFSLSALFPLRNPAKGTGFLLQFSFSTLATQAGQPD